VGVVDQGAVLAWGLAQLRDLPWRQSRDPWAVLVSEVMLQQTQAQRVVPRWFAFLERFPDAGTCAAADLADVLREWQGLGYPRRARNLHATAVAVSESDGWPDTVTGLMALPGIGPYTARAVVAFAFERDVAVVDTNIARVLARVEGRRLTAREAQAAADAALVPGRSWAWNQCLMDLGAVLCRPRPRCAECPLVQSCAWRGDGPDPAVGSAGVSVRQAPFEGSDRQARGRLMRALGEGPVEVVKVPEVMGRGPEAAQRLTTDLVADGLVCRDGSVLRLGR
jgi:A/G-specific adenine glycosylase